jgi:hypothetical protein
VSTWVKNSLGKWPFPDKGFSPESFPHNINTYKSGPSIITPTNTHKIGYYVSGGKALEFYLNKEIVNKLNNNRNVAIENMGNAHLAKYSNSIETIPINDIALSFDWDIHLFLHDSKDKALHMKTLVEGSTFVHKKLVENLQYFQDDIESVLNIKNFTMKKNGVFNPPVLLTATKNGYEFRKIYMTIASNGIERNIPIIDITCDLDHPDTLQVAKYKQFIYEIGIGKPDFEFHAGELANYGKYEGIWYQSLFDTLSHMYYMTKDYTHPKHEKYIRKFVLLMNFFVNEVIDIRYYAKIYNTSINKNEAYVKLLSEYNDDLREFVEYYISDVEHLNYLKSKANMFLVIEKFVSGTNGYHFAGFKTCNIMYNKHDNIIFDRNAISTFHSIISGSVINIESLFKEQLVFPDEDKTILDNHVKTYHYNKLVSSDTDKRVKGYTGSENLAWPMKEALFKDISKLDSITDVGGNASVRQISNTIFNTICSISDTPVINANLPNKYENKNSKDFTVYNGRGNFFLGNIDNFDYSTVKLGQNIMTQFHISTTTDMIKTTAFGYCPCCIFKINIPRYSTYLCVLDYSIYSTEKEIMLPFGSLLTIKDIQYSYFAINGKSNSKTTNIHSSLLDMEIYQRVVITLDYIGPPANIKDVDSFINVYRYMFNIDKQNIAPEIMPLVPAPSEPERRDRKDIKDDGNNNAIMMKYNKLNLLNQKFYLNDPEVNDPVLMDDTEKIKYAVESNSFFSF